MKKIVGFISLLAILLSTFGVAYAQAPDPGSGTSYGAVQNVDSTGAATFRQDFYDPTGQLDATRSKANVATGDTMGLTTNQTTDAPLDQTLPTGWVGSSVVSSDKEAAAVVLIQYVGGSIGTDGVTTADYVGELSPGSNVFCPSVGKRNNEDTSITIMNTSASAISDVSISFKNRDGTDAGTPMTGQSIPGYAQKTYNLFDAAFALDADFLGAAQIQSTGGSPLAVVALTHWGSAGGAFGTFAYNCQPTAAAATTLYAPKVQRRAPDWFGGAWYDSSGIIVVNTDATNPATARVEFYDRAGALSGVFTDTVPAGSARGYNTEYVGNADATVINGLIGTGTSAEPEWQGSAVVTSVGGQPLVGVVKQGYEGTFWAAGYNMLSDANAAQDWFFPLMYRRGFNKPWTDYAGIICQNVTAASVAPQVTYTNRATAATGSFTDGTAFGQFVSHGYNTRYGGNQVATWYGDPNTGATGSADIAANFLGSAAVSAASNIVCIQETWAEEVWDGTQFLNGGDANLNNVYGK